MNKKPNIPLGRGLGAILAQGNSSLTSANSVTEIELNKIFPNQDQPRQFFDEKSLDELAQSIKIHGIIQPITVRKRNEGNFEIVSGERRWQASKKIGLNKIPVYIRDIGDETILQIALIENIQRDDLNAMEIATSYCRLAEEFNMTHQDIANQVGKDRATVTNYMRLLKLPTEIQIGLRAKKIYMGHARAILSIEDHNSQLNFYNICVEKELSVRALENLISQREEVNKKKNNTSTISNLYDKKTIVSYTNHISTKLNSKVKISTLTDGTGELKIKFNNPTELDRLFNFLNNKNHE